ncbi:hypothetical protein GOODEAATRI_029853 [Goodea atripinnis]|uniref:Arginine vasotocin receptor n=1 Tax=Goodea atripinnis TaxID=208336 RepID=A0ABV0PTK3_9TELE
MCFLTKSHGTFCNSSVVSQASAYLKMKQKRCSQHARQYLAIQLCRCRSFPGSDLFQDSRSHPGSMGCHRLHPSSWLRTHSKPKQWCYPPGTRLGQSSCLDMCSSYR